MVRVHPRAHVVVASPHPSYLALAQSFKRSLLAENKSPRTIETYLEAVRFFGEFLAERNMPQVVENIHREHVEEFITDQLSRHTPGTAHNRYRSLHSFFNWLVAEDEIAESPMARMSPPKLPEAPPDVMTETQLQALIQTCEGRAFADRRDMAIVRLLIDTGMRRMEIAGLRLEDLDLDVNVAKVHGKGDRVRFCQYGRKAAVALDRYLRARAQHPEAESTALWLGRHGPMTPNGLYQAVRERARVAGVEHVYTHLFRHTWAHLYLANGGQETNLMYNAGWRSRAMLQRYGASALGERARNEAKRLSPGDRL